MRQLLVGSVAHKYETLVLPVKHSLKAVAVPNPNAINVHEQPSCMHCTGKSMMRLRQSASRVLETQVELPVVLKQRNICCTCA